MLNKIIYINSDDESEKLYYFLASDGTVSGNGYLRIYRYRLFISQTSFNETAILNPQKNIEENLIEIEGERNLIN